MSIWEKHYNKRQRQFEESIKESIEERKKEEMKHSCDNCGASPPTRYHWFDGSGDSFMEGFNAWLCEECYKKLDDWCKEIRGW